jgi:hypothetical protein
VPSITQPLRPRHVTTDGPENALLGVDTHKDFHAAAVITTVGATLDGRSFPATADGYRQLRAWACPSEHCCGQGSNAPVPTGLR